MGPPLWWKLQLGREPEDCATACLATFLGVSYEDALRAITEVDDDKGKRGLCREEIIEAAKELGSTLKFRRVVDLDFDQGILLFENHTALIWSGLVFDPDGRIFEADDYLAYFSGEFGGLEGILSA